MLGFDLNQVKLNEYLMGFYLNELNQIKIFFLVL